MYGREFCQNKNTYQMNVKHITDQYLTSVSCCTTNPHDLLHFGHHCVGKNATAT